MIHRSTLISIACLFAILSYAQKDFADLPAKVKLKMALEEETASENDPIFQTLMKDGMEYFEAREFDLAIEKFEEAGQKRPINVYPPVMIEDVKLAMSLPQEEPEMTEPELEIPAEPDTSEPEMTAEERVEKMYQEELAKVYAEIPKDPKPIKEEPKVEPEVLATVSEGLVVRDKEEIIADGGVLIKEAETVMSVEPPIVKETVKETIKVEESKPLAEIQEELAEEFPDGVSEEIYTEGNRTITKRVVVVDGKGDEYRKVKHGWGGVFYFKNGTSITERVWKEETE